MFRSVLVALDGSPFGEWALPAALDIARRAGAALELVHVHLVPSRLFTEYRPNMEVPTDAQARERAGSYLDGVARQAGAAGVPVTARLLDGAVPDALGS